jgi:hypothetical protein
MRYGIETWILRHMPAIILAGLVPGAFCAMLLADVPRLVALAFIVAWLLGLVHVALVCFIVAAMKGPARTADSYAGPVD